MTIRRPPTHHSTDNTSPTLHLHTPEWPKYIRNRPEKKNTKLLTQLILTFVHIRFRCRDGFVCFCRFVVRGMRLNTIFSCFLDDQSSQGQKKQLRIPSRGGPDHPSIDDLDNQESVVKIMVESPKDPPNSDFASTFPMPASVTNSSESVSAPCAIIEIGEANEPIDVNTPRDTTNIFYAYDESDANRTQPDAPPAEQQTITQSAEPEESHVEQSDPSNVEPTAPSAPTSWPSAAESQPINDSLNSSWQSSS